MSYKGKFQTNLKKPDGAKSKLMNSKEIMKFGWKTKINLDNGLRKTIDWYKENEEFI